uniref:F-box domain-containing protein n=1 Tax=Oryza rufipogon TaxID=4529 RepID=A0A0E0Q7B0_ORYRU
MDDAIAALPPELVSEILLRLRPDEPEHLFRASLVCKAWLRAICDPVFLRRYRAFHGSPPLLGLLHRLRVIDGDPAPRLARTTAAPSEWSSWPPTTTTNSSRGVCIHRRPVCGARQQLLMMAINPGKSAARSRGEYYRTPYVHPKRCALVGDEIYFTLRNGNTIIEYNWGKNRLSMFDPPTSDLYYIALTVMENGSLGFAGIEGSSLNVWSRKVNPQGAAEWVLCRIIELEKIIPVVDLSDEACVVGSAEGLGVIFVSTGVGLFTIELKSRRVKKVEEPGVYFSVLPYMSFYTPEICKSC